MYGASAGAINATYFLTGQREGVDIYAEDIANKTFCDLGRLVGRHAGVVKMSSYCAMPGSALCSQHYEHGQVKQWSVWICYDWKYSWYRCA